MYKSKTKKGIMVFNNGRIYEGEWLNNTKYG